MEVGPMQSATATGVKLQRSIAESAMREAAEAFEAAYLAEMLKQSGINSMPDSFGGGAGEDAFSGLLTGEYAQLLAKSGGIGLAEHIFQAIKARGDAE